MGVDANPKLVSRVIRGLHLFVLGSFLITLAGLAGWLYSRGTLFKLSQVWVESDNPVLVSDLQAQFVDQLGKSLFSISLSEIDAVLRKHPQIERAAVKKRWPSTLQIFVEERKAVAMAFYGSKLWTVDKSCRRIAPLNRPEVLPLLVSTSFAGTSSHEEVQKRNVVKACQFLDEVQRLDSSYLDWREIDEIAFEEDRGVVISSHEWGFRIEVGDRDFSNAWQRAQRAYEHLLRKNIAVRMLDVSYAKRVVFEIDPNAKSPNLQNFKNKLNLKELVQRAR